MKGDPFNSTQRSLRSPELFCPLSKIFLIVGMHLAMVLPIWAALESGVYRTLPGATVEEYGDRVSDKRRVVPFSATVTLNLDTTEPSLTAVLPDAVLEGGDPFPLTVHSSEGGKLNDGTYVFRGDYLEELNPSGSQYLFNWGFSASTNGQVTWNGTTGWAGGHIWLVTISNIILVPDNPPLSISLATDQVQISWPVSYPGFTLERADRLPANNWSAVTNSVSISGDQFSMKLKVEDKPSFFRLRKP